MQIDQLLQEVRREVERKRAEGLYPPGLEQELQSEFQEIIEQQASGARTDLNRISNLVIDYLAVIDHLAMLVVELETRISQLEKGKIAV